MFLPLLALCLPLAAAANDRGEGKLDPSQPTGTTVDAIVQQFAAKEKQFKTAREQYTYTQDVTVDTLDGETVDGQYHQVWSFWRPAAHAGERKSFCGREGSASLLYVKRVFRPPNGNSDPRRSAGRHCRR